jgi:hypothetical protein
MNYSRWLVSPCFFGAILEYYDESNSWVGWNAQWLHPLISAALLSAVAIGLYLIGRFMSPPAQPFTPRRNPYDPAQQ